MALAGGQSFEADRDRRRRALQGQLTTVWLGTHALRDFDPYDIDLEYKDDPEYKVDAGPGVECICEIRKRASELSSTGATNSHAHIDSYENAHVTPHSDRTVVRSRRQASDRLGRQHYSAADWESNEHSLFYRFNVYQSS